MNHEEIQKARDGIWKEHDERKVARRAHFDAQRKRVNIIFSCIAIAYVLAWCSWPFVMRYVFSP